MPHSKITVPKKTTIKGQPHELAYINDREQGLLMALGGSGEMVNGVPAYFDGFGDNRSQGGFGGATSGFSDEDMDQDEQQDIAAAAAEAAGIDMGGYNYGDDFSAKDNAKAIAETMNAVMGGDVNQKAQDAISRQLKQAENLYGLPKTGVIPAAMGLIGKYTLEAIRDVLAKGGRPQFDARGNIVGAYGKGLLGGEVYTGNPVKGIPDTGYVDPLEDKGDDSAQVVPPNPMTGTCPEGYIFDDDLQACRLDTGSARTDDGFGNSEADGLMYRPTALDQAPAFGGDGFAEANKQFVESFAYNPDYYENQMNLTGFAPVSGLLG
tara:strand:+ start:269 stop:1234 length:966 start_codon:yes stop_codon:yes gene_type:complete